MTSHYKCAYALRPTSSPLQNAPQSAPAASGTASEILAQLRARGDLIQALIDGGPFGEVYVPAFEAKDLALALESGQRHPPHDKRRALDAAVAAFVRSAYLLDALETWGTDSRSRPRSRSLRVP